MMLTYCPSHLFCHRRSLSETHLENKLNSSVWDSAKSVHTISSCAITQWNPKGEGGQCCVFRRTLSQSSLIPRNKHSHQSMRKWRCSRKNGLLVAEDELAKVAMHVEEKDPLKTHRTSFFVRQIQSEGGRILRPTKKEDKKISIKMKSELLDGNPSVSGNGMVAENYSSLEVGPNGVVLMCNERGCSPAHPSETEYATNGEDSNRIGSNQGISGAYPDGTDVYYQKMLESNPGNPLLLSNYAKFLHEVQHDVEKAEKYYKRALMASPADGEILSMYAKFIWDTHNDAAQAEVYFRKAVEVASEDCYVVASYAHFLWNSTDDEEEENGPSLTSSDSETTAA